MPPPDLVSQSLQLDIPTAAATLLPSSSLTSLPTLLVTQVHDHVVASDLAWYNASGYVMDLVHFTHDMTGLSYAASVASITMGIRLFFILPFGIVSLRADPNIDRDLQDLTNRIKSATKGSGAQYNAMVAQHKDLVQRRKQLTIRSFAMPIMSFGTFILMWFGLRYMGVYYPEDLATGGTLWFPDLTQRDPLMFLPILSSVSFLLMGEVGADQLGRPVREFSPFWANAWRFFRVSTVVLFIDAPAAIFCYWIPNSFTSVAQSIALSQPSVRAAIGVIPKRQQPKKGEPVVTFVQDNDDAALGAGNKEGCVDTIKSANHSKGRSQISVNKKRKSKRKR